MYREGAELNWTGRRRRTTRAANDRRTCRKCGTPLGRDNREAYCSPCKENLFVAHGRVEATPRAHRGRQRDRAGDSAVSADGVMSLAGMLLADPSRWGLMGIEFAFFHQFFNDDLQGELRDMRHQLYGRTDPPLPMSMGEAERSFGFINPTLGELLGPYAELLPTADVPDSKRSSAAMRAAMFVHRRHVDETVTVLADRLQKAGLLRVGDEVDLEPSLLILLVPIGARRVPSDAFWTIVKRLREMKERLPAHADALPLALVCGTPPIPPNVLTDYCFHAGAAVPLERLRLCVYSAKADDIRPFYSLVTAGLAQPPSPSAPRPAFRWREGCPSYLESLVGVEGAALPTAGSVQQAFRRARTGKRFYDSPTKVKDYRAEVEAWAKATLCLACDMSNRDALELWTERHADARLSFSRSGSAGGVTASQEIVFSGQLKRIDTRIKRIRAMAARAASAA